MKNKLSFLLTFLKYLAGLPAKIVLSGTIVPDLTYELAPIKELFPIIQLLYKIDPIPITASFFIFWLPNKITLCPIVTLFSITISSPKVLIIELS